jgi:uncharacterized protein (TIGR00299 family) protein
VGSGTVKCDHGIMPVPTPATVGLLKGVPLAETDEPGELTTPTGAAILTTLARAYGPVPGMSIASFGFGAGTRDGKTRPNVLRLVIGDAADQSAAEESDEITILEANLDDATGQQVGHAIEALFAAGALDVFTTAIQMKKNRPAVMVSVLTDAQHATSCENVLFSRTTTFGVRRHLCRRQKLARSFDSVATQWGPVRIKVGRRNGRVITASPEYDDCAAIARDANVALRDVMFAAEQAWRAAHPKDA